MFNSIQFIANFDRQLKHLATSEKISKALLQTMSRDLLALLHTKNEKQGDIGYINRTIHVLTPVNRKVFIAFCKEFTGFILNDGGILFVKKSKKHYDEVQAKALAWLEDPMNNIWSWADRNIEIVPREFTIDAIKKSTETLLKKAEKNGINKVDAIAAMFEGGISVNDLIAVMDKLGYEFAEAGAEDETPAALGALPNAPF